MSGDLTAAESEATAPKLEPSRQRADRLPTSGNSVSSRGTSSLVRKREWAVELAYSVSRSCGCRNATTVSATSSRWIRLSRTVFAAAYWRKSGPSWTSSSGYDAVRRKRAGRYRVTGQSRRSARLGTVSGTSSPGRASGSGIAHSGGSYPCPKQTDEAADRAVRELLVERVVGPLDDGLLA